MKVFALGGYGAFGMVVAKVLAESEHVSEITFAGRNWERAKQAAAKIGDKVEMVT
jgi:saccharopine dehydrogenase-like NADP-dependent oxidoreductase